MTDEIASGGEEPITPAAGAAEAEIKDDVTKTDAEKSAEAKSAEGEKKPDAAKKDEGADDSEKASEAGKELAKRKQTMQDRLNEVTRARRDAERRADNLSKEVAELRGKLKEPDPEKFDDISDLTAAKVNHTMDQRDVARLETQATEARKQADTAKLETFHAKADEAREKYTDFDDVVIKPAKLPMSQDTQSLILDMDESAEVIYHLAKNVAEAKRIDSLSEREKAFELGKIASKITQPPPRKITQAAAPIESVGGKSSGAAGFNPEKASVEDFSARYRAMKEKERA